MLYRRSSIVLSILSLLVLAVGPAVLLASFHASSTTISARGQSADGFRILLPLLTRDGPDALPAPDTITPTAPDAPMDPVLPAATLPVSTVTGLLESTPTETASLTATVTLAETTSPTVAEALLPTATASPAETPLPTETATPIATSMPTATAWPTETTSPTDTRVPDEQSTPEASGTQEPQFDQSSLQGTDEATTLPLSSDADLVTKQFPSPTATFVEAPPYPGPNDVPLPTIEVPTSLPADQPAYPGPGDVLVPATGVPAPLPTNPSLDAVPTSDTGSPELPTERPFTDAPTEQVFPTPVPLGSTMPPSGQQGLTIGHLIALALWLLIIGSWMQWQKSALWHHARRQSAGRVPRNAEADDTER